MLVHGDITTEQVDAIVNAANSALLGGGGVDGAIHRAAGPALLAECRHLRNTPLPAGLPTGQAVATGAGELTAQWVIHTVGPNRHADETDVEDLRACFHNSMNLAQDLDVRSITFPAIGAGVYGWSATDVAHAAHDVLGDTAAAAERWPGIHEVRFVLFSPQVLATFQQVFATA